jgi:hypothetical protein
MKTKVKNNYLYTGLGFPVLLDQVEIVLLGNEWHPKIDVRKVANIVIEVLAAKESPLTGNEVRFVRTHFGMSLRDFANNVVHETHTAVKKWEDKRDEPTKMNPNTEFVIRNYIIEETSTKSEKKAKYFGRTVQARKFYAQKNSKPITPIVRCA